MIDIEFRTHAHWFLTESEGKFKLHWFFGEGDLTSAQDGGCHWSEDVTNLEILERGPYSIHVEPGDSVNPVLYTILRRDMRVHGTRTFWHWRHPRYSYEAI